MTPIFQTAPLTITDLPADREHKSVFRWNPRRIVMHATAGTDSRLWLSKSSQPPVSCHRLIMRDGENIKIVPDDEQAYTQGYAVMGGRGPNVIQNGKPISYLTIDGIRYVFREGLNLDSLSIELENLNNGIQEYTLAQYRMAALQVCEWHGMYGFIPVLSHADIDPRKNDPLGFNWEKFYIYLRDAYRTALQ